MLTALNSWARHSRWGFLSALSLTAAVLCTTAAIRYAGRPEIIRSTVDFTDSASHPLENVTLPFREEVVDQQPGTFLIRIHWRKSALSSGMFRVTPRDCILGMRINDGPLQPIGRTELPCKYSSLIDAWPGWRPGVYNFSLMIEGGVRAIGVNVVPVYSPLAILVMVGLLWTMMCGWLVRPVKALANRNPWTGRVALLLALPFLGCLINAVTLYNADRDVSFFSPAILSLLNGIVIFGLWLHRLGLAGNAPGTSRISVPFAFLALAFFAASSLSLTDQREHGLSAYMRGDHHYDREYDTTLHLLVMGGLITSILAVTPRSLFIRRVTKAPSMAMIALLAGNCVGLYEILKQPLWKILSPSVGMTVSSLLQAMGVPVRMHLSSKLRADGAIDDYYAGLSVPEFALKIGKGCSGLEGCFLFIFLISLFVIFDWSVFSRVKRLWQIYVMAVLLAMAVNVLRITSLFLYGTWLVADKGWKAGMQESWDLFHSHIGLVLYLVAFAVLFPLLYRWAVRSAKRFPEGRRKIS